MTLILFMCFDLLQSMQEEIEEFYSCLSARLDQTPVRSPIFDPFHTRELEEKTYSFNPLFQPMFEQGEQSSPDEIYSNLNASSSSSSTSLIQNPFEMAVEPQTTLKELTAPTLEN